MFTFENIETIFIFLTVSYVILSVALTIGLLMHKRRREEYEPTVTVIVPARNEQASLKKCLESLSRVEYPRGKFKVIVVNDSSDDATGEIADRFSKGYFSVLHLNEADNPGLGKAGALIHGYQAADSEVIMQTDADCVVPVNWVRTMVGYFREETGIVGGITTTTVGAGELEGRRSPFAGDIIAEEIPAGDFFGADIHAGVQSLDWLYMLNAGVAAASLGVPLSCIGNNLAIKREAYDSVGGYEGIGYSITEDFALFQAVIKKGWKSAFAAEADALILTLPMKTLKEFFFQRQRWASGGLKLAGPGIILLAAAFFLHLLIIAAVPIGISVGLYGALFGAKTLADLLFLYVATGKTNCRSSLKYFLLYEPFYCLYITLFGFTTPFFATVAWKKRKPSV